MDVTISPVALQITPALGVHDDVPPRGPADAGAVSRFNAAMDAPEAATAAAGPDAVQAASPAATGTIGDKVLGGLQNMSTEFQQTWDSYGRRLKTAGADIRPTDLLMMQMDVSAMSITHEMTGKLVSKATQNIEQLVKMQ